MDQVWRADDNTLGHQAAIKGHGTYRTLFGCTSPMSADLSDPCPDP
jgi:hypothetical protein